MVSIASNSKLYHQAALRQGPSLEASGEARFHRIIWLARELFAAPMALISLVDPQGRSFKAAQGVSPQELDPVWASFTDNVKMAPLVVGDTLDDSHFFQHPPGSDNAGIRSFMAAPVYLKGNCLGIVAVMDSEPRAFSQNDSLLLTSLAEWVGRELMANELPQPASAACVFGFDPLTGLCDRESFECYLNNRFESADRRFGAVAVMNLSRFRTVNEALDYASGDRALAEFAQRLTGLLAPEELAGRVYGDEFVLFLPTEERDQALQRLGFLAQALEAEPLQFGGRAFPVQLRLGISFASDHCHQPGRLLKQASLAMNGGRESRGIRCFSEDLTEAAHRRFSLSAELDKAVQDGQFTVHYQPQWRWHGKGWHLQGMEALMRWQHPGLGIISPAEFIPLAEESGTIVPLGLEVMDTALAFAAQWFRRFPRMPRLAVNLSPIQLLECQLATQIQGMLERHDLPPDCLELEVTETALIQDQAAAARKLEALHHLGLRLALDDFGTGYSSLTHILELPFHSIKIDKSFVSNLPDSQANLAVIDGMLTLGRGMKKELVAEGIENQDQLDCLLNRGVRLFQGYLLGRPGDAQSIQRLLCASQGDDVPQQV